MQSGIQIFRRGIVGAILMVTLFSKFSVLGEDLEIVSFVEGHKGPGFKAAANVMGAVGSQHVVDFTIMGFTVHDKASGKVLKQSSQREFWRQVQPHNSLDPHPEANDPWMVYDPLSNRWFATIAATGSGESYLAVSSSADPTQPWKGVSLPLPRIDPGLKIGVDQNGVYISCANGAENPLESLDVFVIPKDDAIQGGGPSLAQAQTFTKIVYAAFPAVNFDKEQGKDTPAILINNEFGGPTCGELYLHRITWSGMRATLSPRQTIPLSRRYAVPRMKGLQPADGIRLLQAGGRRNNCAFVQGGSVFSCNGAQRTADSRPGILWYEVRISDGALLQEGFVESPDYDFLYPSLAVDRHGNVGIGCTRTSEKEYPSVCVMMHAAGDPAGTMRMPCISVPGTTAYKYSGVSEMNFSNYSTTCIDPSDEGLLWTYQGYAGSSVDRQWCSAWSAFRWKSKSHEEKENVPANEDQVTRNRASFVGKGARTGTHRRPLLLVNEKRYELKRSETGEASVEGTLKKISQGDSSTYSVQGTIGQINSKEGILVDRIVEVPLQVAKEEIQLSPSAVTSSVVTVAGRKYSVYEYTDPDSKTFCVVIPEGLKTVRGLLVNSNYFGGDSRGDWTFCHYYREFMHLHDFAIVAANGTCPQTTALNGFQTSLDKISVASQHAELKNVPYVAIGFSAGGGFASTLLTHEPRRTIAAGIIEARYNFDVFRRPGGPMGPTTAHMPIPSILFVGGKHNPPEIQTGIFKMVDDVFAPWRPQGAQYAWLVLPDYGHEYAENRQEVLAMPLLDYAVRTRYPRDADVTKGALQLIDIDPKTGWIADNTTWNSGLTKIYPAAEYQGDIGHSSWLQNEDMAFIYRAYATHNNPIKITSPSACGPGTPAMDPGSNVTITVDVTKFPNWKSMAFYDGARKLDEITQGLPQCTATDLAPGYHVFSVLAVDAQGKTRTSDPVMVVVRKLP